MVTPELAIGGYPPRDLLEREAFVRDLQDSEKPNEVRMLLQTHAELSLLDDLLAQLFVHALCVFEDFGLVASNTNEVQK